MTSTSIGNDQILPNMSQKPKKLVKIILLGDCSVGKTSLMNQYVHFKFSLHYKSTIGADFLTKKLDLPEGPVTLQVQIHARYMDNT